MREPHADTASRGRAPGVVLAAAGLDPAAPWPPRSTGTPPFTPETAAAMSEATLQSHVLSLATVTLDWLGYHTHDSRRSQPGFPDLVLVSAKQGRLIFAELKTQSGRQSRAQVQWESHLREAGHGEVYLWRPTHWLSGEIGRILQRRPDATGRPGGS